MTDTLDIPDKFFFRIGEVSELLGVQAHVLRYWETEFPSLKPQKSRTNQRRYRRKEIEQLAELKRLLYEEGYTIAGARKRFAQARNERREKKSHDDEKSSLHSKSEARIRIPADAPKGAQEELRRLKARCDQLEQELEQERASRERLTTRVLDELTAIRELTRDKAT